MKLSFINFLTVYNMLRKQYLPDYVSIPTFAF